MLEEEKVWGRVRHIFDGPIQVSILSVNAGGFSSVHRHVRRFNHFLVVSGMIRVRLYSGSNHDHVTMTHKLYSGDSYTVRPGVLHKFECVKSGQVVETYWTEDGSPAEQEDIERLTVSGMTEPVLHSTGAFPE